MTRNVRTVGERIEELLDSLRAGSSQETAEELVRLLLGMYGEGLARVVAILREHDPALIDQLAKDELLEDLLLLHDLHPLDVDTRIRRALDRVRPRLGSRAGWVEYLGIDSQGVVRLRVDGDSDGCPSSAHTVRKTIEAAVQDAAPETTGVEVTGVTSPATTALLQIGMGPPPGWRPGSGTARWSRLPDIDPSAQLPVSTTVDGIRVLVYPIRGSLYAYRDACTACGSSLSGSTLDGDVLTCSRCDRRFNLELAGRCMDDTAHHLDPLPLRSDNQGIRIAVAGTVAS